MKTGKKFERRSTTKTKTGASSSEKELPSPPGFQSEEKRWRYTINEDEFIEGYEAASE